MSRHLSSSGCRATLPQLSPHLLLNFGLVTTSIYPTLEGPVYWESGGGHHCDRPGREWPYTCAPGTGKTQIVCGLIRGLDGNLTLVIKAELANVMLDMAHEEAPDPRRLRDIFYNERASSLATYQFEVSLWLGPTCSQCVGMYSTLGYG